VKTSGWARRRRPAVTGTAPRSGGFFRGKLLNVGRCQFFDIVTRKRAWEIGSAAALLLAVTASVCGYLYRQHLNDRLLTAARQSDLEAGRELLARGADPNARTQAGDPAVILAAGVPSGAFVKLLLERGAYPDLPGRDGATALIEAAGTGHADIFQILIRSGASVNARDAGGWTALHYAAANGRVAIVRQLLRAGARSDLKNSRGETALTRARKTLGYNDGLTRWSPAETRRVVRARRQVRAEIVRLLQQHGAKE
jgi:hypothetical protein